MKCRACKSEKLYTFLSLGRTPLANSFLRKEELDSEEKSYPLEVCICQNCKMVQLTYVVPPALMFSRYVYMTSVAMTGREHFTKMAEDISREFKLNKDSLAVDIGSNDGTLLKGFQKAGVQSIGVEPAKNIARIAEENGVETVNDFFSEKSVSKIISGKGKADVVTATNVFAHVDDIEGLAKNVKVLLKEDGIFVIEAPYLGDLLEKTAFDTIYHEHLSYISVTPLAIFFKRIGMKIFKVERVDIHGGSLRMFVEKKSGAYKVDESVAEMLEHEKATKLDDIETYKKFAEKVYETKRKLLEFLKEIKAKGKTIAAYTAPAKANTLLNFCGIGKEYIEYIVDDTPLKQGLYTPGTRIPVVSKDMFDEKKPDYILILAWNFSDEILKKTQNYKEEGVNFIIPLPEPRIV